MVWNVRESGLEKTSEWMYVRACIKTSKNLNIYISGITQPIELKFGKYEGKVKVFLSSV